ncbi:rust resistance kinase Lr10-like [Apium graveolens]|uniref:rust resistance kinase Lr10-like n=1 Tax=Apium graveolens TaxID=4045 RepID=UPI003D792DF6
MLSSADIGAYVRLVCGTAFIIGCIVYKLRRRHLSVYDNIEDFLQRQNNFMPIRYSYSQLKNPPTGLKINSVKEALVLIHHINIVRLVGFCVEGPKRALVYEFMPNGSLDKYIFVDGDESEAGRTTFQGEHWVTWLQNYFTKYWRFSMKADVYSFGMLLMEMAGKRKNINPLKDEISQIYFPSWIYDQISKGKEIEIEDATENEKMLVKKMIIVAMWCIQMKPAERPSMHEVIGMLEGDLELLVMPPKPLICPEDID